MVDGAHGQKYHALCVLAELILENVTIPHLPVVKDVLDQVLRDVLFQVIYMWSFN